MERKQDKAKIASLERYIENIHSEFTKNNELMKMLMAKCDNDKNIQSQVNDLRLSLSYKLSSKMDEKAVQTDQGVTK